MIKLCKRLLYKPKYCPDADSAIMKHLVSSVTIVLVCLAAISFSAYAFFSHSITSASSSVKASNFTTSISIKDSNGTPVAEGKLDAYSFGVGQYTVTISTDADTTGSGFCIIHVGETKYYTQQLGKDLNAPNGERNQISFLLDLQSATTVGFDSRWGTSSYYSSATESDFYIKDTTPLRIISIGGAENISETPAETQPTEPSAPAETEETIDSTQPVETTVPEESTTAEETAE